MKRNFILFRQNLLPFLLLFSLISNAQKTGKLDELRLRILSDAKVKTVNFSGQRQTPDFIAFNTGVNNYSASQASVALNNFLGVRGNIDFLKIDKQFNLNEKAEVIEFQQFFKGVKVDLAKFKAFVKEGKILFFNGAYYNVDASASATPSLSLSRALQIAKDRINAKRYASDEIEALLKKSDKADVVQVLKNELQEVSPKGELVFVQNFNKKDVAEVRLAYKFNIYAIEPLSRSWVYVDANDGTILLVDAIIKHVENNMAPPPLPTSVAAAVQTRYAGTRNIFVKQISGNDPNSGLLLQSSHPTNEVYIPGAATWGLMDDTRGNGIETYDLNGVGGLPVSVPPAYTVAKSFTDVDNNWTLAQHKRAGVTDGAAEAENDDIAWDAHWGAGIVYDYWKNNQNRLSFDGNNAKIKSYIHSGVGYDNAFWNGSVMTYGDGSGVAAGGFKPLTSLDVCAHEIGHGVCEFTSNLVYANESGAMNEALSDIWAACLEYYAIKKVDANLSKVYKPFYIGEQIAADPTRPLRRMDNPKAEGNPDTYGGVNWTNTVGCTATLANDQCGVHNNSGVLNKWFYLLTVGSGAGSGPDAAFAGQDDGVNDAVAGAHAANPYSVTGLGFSVAEKITYLMETMLTSTATYAEARNVSIAVATEMSGTPCSAIVESVTNAWYAVGVGDKFVKPCTVTYGFPIVSNMAITEPGNLVGCTASKPFNISVIMPPNSTLTGTVSGTATHGLDYSLTQGVIQNTTAAIVKKTLTLNIFNDGSTEGDETAILTLSLTNTGTNPVNKTFKLTIMDDDVPPVIGSTQKVLLSETFTRANGFADPTGWTEKLEIPEAANGDPAASGKNQWGIFDNKLTITGKEGTTGITLPNATYNSNSNSQTLIKSPLLDARGLSVLTLKFDYKIQGEVDVLALDPENLPAFDYMAVAYSLDGVNFIELNTGDLRQFAAVSPTSGTINTTLPASLTNKKFYLAFRWFNDTNAGGPFSVTIDNLNLTGTPRSIESQLNHNGREVLGWNQEVYFYSVQDGQILSKVKNGLNRSLGCTNVYVEKAGTNTFNLYQGTDGLHKVGDKLVRIETSYIYSAPTTVTLFYTEAELKGLEAATAKSRSTFSVYKVNAPGFASSTSANTKRYTPIYTALPGVGATYTISFTDVVNGSYALGTIVSQPGFRTATPITNVLDNEIKEWRCNNVYPNPAKSNAQFNITAPVQQKVRLDIISLSGQLIETQMFSVSKGSTNLKLRTNKLTPGSYLLYLKNEKGEILNRQKLNKE